MLTQNLRSDGWVFERETAQALPGIAALGTQNCDAGVRAILCWIICHVDVMAEFGSDVLLGAA